MKLSHSSVSMFTECPGKWRFKYVDKLPEKPKHFFSFGKSVHSALEYMYEGDECPTLTQVLMTYNAKWVSEAYKDAAAEAKAKREGTTMLTAYYKKHATAWRKPLAVEMKFDIAIDHVRVIGYIDRVDVMPNGKLHIIDYKTGRMWDEKKAPTSDQLTTYQYAMEAMGMGQVGKLSLLHVPSLAWDSSPTHGGKLIVALRAKYAAAANSISRGEFPYTPSEKACNFCDFKVHCPAWK